MKKRVYIAWSHHHVVREWFKYRERGMHLLSFDYHTDFHKAFIRKSGNPSANYAYSSERHNSYLKKHIPCNDIEAAIKDLVNDEHIDFALRSGMIKRAFVFSHDVNTSHDARIISIPNRIKQIWQAEIISYCEVNHPLATPTPYNDTTEAKMARINASDEVISEVVKTFREYGFDQSNYILDFDCDFIRDRDAMTHGKFDILKQLIKGAYAITIAQEPSFVYDCSKYTLSYEDVEAWFVKLIQDCECDPEIEYDDLAQPVAGGIS